jgi:hypothetical protein
MNQYKLAAVVVTLAMGIVGTGKAENHSVSGNIISPWIGRGKTAWENARHPRQDIPGEA